MQSDESREATTEVPEDGIEVGAEEDFRPRPASLLDLEIRDGEGEEVSLPPTAGEASLPPPPMAEGEQTDDSLPPEIHARSYVEPPVVVGDVAEFGAAGMPRGGWPAGHTTGAFVSRAASFRYDVAPYRWTGVFGSMAVLYGVFIGLPVLLGVWSLWRVGLILGWW